VLANHLCDDQAQVSRGKLTKAAAAGDQTGGWSKTHRMQKVLW